MEWLVLAALGTLGVMLAFVRWGLPEPLLVAWTFFEPIEAFRLGIVAALESDLSLLGPAGTGIVAHLGAAGTQTAAAAALAAWVAGLWFAGRALFK